MKLFNEDLNSRLSGNQSLGGSPVFINDLCNLQDLSLLYGIYGQYKDWNVVLSGCLLDTCDVNASTCTITDGLVMIEGIIYKFDGYTGTYPFEIQTLTADDDERLYANGTTQTFGKDYTGKLTTNTSFPLGFTGGYPTKYVNENVKAIYFDPATSQRLSFLTKYLTKNVGDVEMIGNNSLTLTYTETGNLINNGSISKLYDTNHVKYNNIGYVYNADDNNRALWVGDINNTGSDSFVIQRRNLPSHQHEINNPLAGGSVNITESNHDHSIKIGSEPATGDPSPSCLLGANTIISTNTFRTSIEIQNLLITGLTGYGNTQGYGEATENPIMFNIKKTSKFNIIRRDSLPYNFSNKNIQNLPYLT